jgi:hypothetical protein
MLTWVLRGSGSGSSHNSPAPTAQSSKLRQLQALAPTTPTLAPSSLPLDVLEL